MIKRPGRHWTRRCPWHIAHQPHTDRLCLCIERCPTRIDVVDLENYRRAAVDQVRTLDQPPRIIDPFRNLGEGRLQNPNAELTARTINWLRFIVLLRRLRIVFAVTDLLRIKKTGWLPFPEMCPFEEIRPCPKTCFPKLMRSRQFIRPATRRSNF